MSHLVHNIWFPGPNILLIMLCVLCASFIQIYTWVKMQNSIRARNDKEIKLRKYLCQISI